MTTERTSFDDPGSNPTTPGGAFDTTDALVGTRDEELTAGLSDAPFPEGAGTSTPATGSGDPDTAWATDKGAGSSGRMYGSSRSGSGGMVPTMDSPTGGSGLGDAAGSIASRVADTAGGQLETTVNGQMTRGADVLGQVSNAIRRSGEQLRGEQPQIAGFADTAAQQVDKAGEFLRQNDLAGVVREVEGFARRQPAVFLGGALALGVLASRFLKASPPDTSRDAAYRYDSNGRA